MERKYDLLPLLPYIDADDYGIWLEVGMALKYEGYTCDDWDSWSRSSSKYKPGVCESKWDSFNGSQKDVTGGTIIHLAKEGGWEPKKDLTAGFLAWDATIGVDKSKAIVDEGFLDKDPIPKAPVGDKWKPTDQLYQYIDTLFQPDDIIGYCTESMKKEGEEKYVPKNSGVFTKTAGEIMQYLKKYDDISFAVGDYNKEGGAWIRINPLDGKGVSNSNVVDFRYALVESDDIDLEKQYNIIKEMKLPVAALVHSGGKSVHAIVKVNALDKDDYARRIQFLYATCEKSGLKVDTKNKNPSRLSRMPGIIRGKNKQYLIATNIGCESWEAWCEYVALIDNTLPDPERLSDLLNNPPPLAPECIEGILRKGHKMLIAGASKAGKSFLLMELCIAIATGTSWVRWKCTRGKVLYINLEIDRPSCVNRFAEIIKRKDLDNSAMDNIEVMSLRGQAAPLDKLVDKLIIKAKDAHYDVIVIDPIYKVITGDENSAKDMANFTNQFDKIAEALGCCVIYCHHHSKGSQGEKRVADRASGSGVFSRDADALLDLIELEVPAEVRSQIMNDKLAEVLLLYFKEERGVEWVSDLSDTSKHSALMLSREAKTYEEKSYVTRLTNAIQDLVNGMTAWRIEGTLREFRGFAPINIWFDYPLHQIDEKGLLKDVQAIGDKNPYAKGGEAVKKKAAEQRLSDDLRFKQCFEALMAENGEVTQPMLFEAFNASREKDSMKPQSRQTLLKKLDNSKFLYKVARHDSKGADLPALIKMKEEEEHYDIPDEFWEN